MASKEKHIYDYGTRYEVKKSVDGKCHHIGSFKDIEDARAALKEFDKTIKIKSKKKKDDKVEKETKYRQNNDIHKIRNKQLDNVITAKVKETEQKYEKLKIQKASKQEKYLFTDMVNENMENFKKWLFS